MARKYILTDEQSSYFRTGRFFSAFFVFLGCIFAFVGTGSMLIPRNEFDPAPIPPALAVAIAIAGLAGIIGGVATFRGSRAWGRLSYLFAGLLLLALPIGTIISLLWFVSSSRYWKVRERMREIEAGNA